MFDLLETMFGEVLFKSTLDKLGDVGANLNDIVWAEP